MVIIGLGNPGRQYENTRHNVGFCVVDQVANQKNILLRSPFGVKLQWNGSHPRGDEPLLIKPITYMNASGDILPFVFKKTKITKDQIIVVLDNLDLPVGTCRLKFGGGDAGHNGLKSIIQHLGTTQFFRLYIGIGRPEHSSMVRSYVLQKWNASENPLYEQSFEKASHACLSLNKDNYQTIANELNRH